MWPWRPPVRIRLATPPDSLAQLAEHLTFNQGVRGSNPRWVTSLVASAARLFFFENIVFIRVSGLFVLYASSLFIDKFEFSKWENWCTCHCKFDNEIMNLYRLKIIKLPSFSCWKTSKFSFDFVNKKFIKCCLVRNGKFVIIWVWE